MIDTKELFRDLLNRAPSRVSVILLYFGNWLFQGQLYSSSEEKIYKLMSFGFIHFCLSLITSKFIDKNSNTLIVLLLSHTLNWIITTNIYSTRSKRYKNKNEDGKETSEIFTSSTDLVKRNINSSNHIVGAVVFGSFARSDAHSNSDVDVHIYRKSGLSSYIQSYLILSRIRFLANVYQLPLEVWVEHLPQKVDSSNRIKPIVIHDNRYNTVKSKHPQSIQLENSTYYNN